MAKKVAEEEAKDAKEAIKKENDKRRGVFAEDLGKTTVSRVAKGVVGAIAGGAVAGPLGATAGATYGAWEGKGRQAELAKIKNAIRGGKEVEKDDLKKLAEAMKKLNEGEEKK